MPNIPALRERIEENTQVLADRYWARENVAELIRSRTALFDDIITSIWSEHFGDTSGAALFAVGGYGRGELHPGSDIDLLVLLKSTSKYRAETEAFLRDVFDLNFEVGHAVRTPKECRDQAIGDLTIATALFERRLLVGDQTLATKLAKALEHRKIWPPEKFFTAKIDEQTRRHARFDNVDYGLEPNIKSSPGGIRDYQTIMWLCLRQFGTTEPDRLVELGVLTPEERDWFTEGRRYLAWVRFGAHLIAGRKDDRLQFEAQRELARRLGFADTEAQLGVERFMQLYYRHVLQMREVNDIVIQHFGESVLSDTAKSAVEPINERFQIRANYLETTSEHVFVEHPPAMLELFVIMANRRDIAGVRAQTIRLIRDHLHLIDEGFRQNETVNALFLAILKAPYMLVSTLTRMRRYGVLGRYIPEFGRVIGQMQHDLFHIYTVDAHTMMVIRNMRRFFYRASEETFPVACHCVKQLPKIELLYIAGLYHDIGKGRGGDHSELGAHDVQAFCQRHGISTADTELVRWLVEKHLFMSDVAQREDIYDPDVVQQFAAEVKSELRLNYLYALTVADINATNPNLWNNYRATLMRHLYGATRRALRRGLESPVDKQATLAALQDSALEKLQASAIALDGLSQVELNRLWELMGDEYILRHSPRHLANVSQKLLSHDPTISPRVLLTNTKPHVDGEAVTEVVLYTNDRPGLFGDSTAALDQLGLSIHEANINTAADGRCFNVYVVLNDAEVAVAASDHGRLADQIEAHLTAPEGVTSGQKRLTRQMKQMSNPPDCTIETTSGADHSTITITALDRPGLLADIGRLFKDFEVQVLTARILTFGERAEDVFEIQTPDGTAFSPQQAYELEHAIRQALDWHQKQAVGA